MRLPERIEGDGLLLRRWRVADAELLARVVAESAEHLRPWMPWVEREPLSIEERRELIAGWERDWQRGGDVVLGIHSDGRVAGGTGLHHRRAPDTLEIGYWLHPDFVGRGLATRAARLLTDAAFSVDGIEHVEIRHDLANERSGAVPGRLGFSAVGESRNPAPAPADTGTDRTWGITRAQWGLVSSER